MISQWLQPLVEWFGTGDLITLLLLVIAIVLIIKAIKD